MPTKQIQTHATFSFCFVSFFFLSNFSYSIFRFNYFSGIYGRAISSVRFNSFSFYLLCAVFTRCRFCRSVNGTAHTQQNREWFFRLFQFDLCLFDFDFFFLFFLFWLLLFVCGSRCHLKWFCYFISTIGNQHRTSFTAESCAVDLWLDW